MEPETKLRASINGLAMKKVTRFFNATTEAIVGEMLQNARRAGATKVRIRTKPKAITIDDDGVGIAEPGQSARVREQRMVRPTHQSRGSSRDGILLPGATQRRGSSPGRATAPADGGSAWSRSTSPVKPKPA